ncbi:MAG: helix-turn-helix transcriptional regulator [Dehalococcoidia bacterium]
MSEPRLPAPSDSVEELTPRQREVLALLVKGKTNFEIAEALGLSLEGAKYHVREITGRLGVESREEAAEWWRRERRPSRRALRGFGWLVPRLALLIGVAAVVAATGVVVAFAVGASGGGGKPAAAYVRALRRKGPLGRDGCVGERPQPRPIGEPIIAPQRPCFRRYYVLPQRPVDRRL